MAEADRRDEEEWSERLENESVLCLSQSFYKAHCSGSDDEKVTDLANITTEHTTYRRTGEVERCAWLM